MVAGLLDEHHRPVHHCRPLLRLKQVDGEGADVLVLSIGADASVGVSEHRAPGRSDSVSQVAVAAGVLCASELGRDSGQQPAGVLEVGGGHH
jgi:hypothetical protein